MKISADKAGAKISAFVETAVSGCAPDLQSHVAQCVLLSRSDLHTFPKKHLLLPINSIMSAGFVFLCRQAGFLLPHGHLNTNDSTKVSRGGKKYWLMADGGERDYMSDVFGCPYLRLEFPAGESLSCASRFGFWNQVLRMKMHLAFNQLVKKQRGRSWQNTALAAPGLRLYLLPLGRTLFLPIPDMPPHLSDHFNAFCQRSSPVFVGV